MPRALRLTLPVGVYAGIGKDAGGSVVKTISGNRGFDDGVAVRFPAGIAIAFQRGGGKKLRYEMRQVLRLSDESRGWRGFPLGRRRGAHPRFITYNALLAEK